MPPQKSYLVRRPDGGERSYQLYELTWLWRTGELPHEVVFRDEAGQWRPVSELVEPILQAPAAAATPAPAAPRNRWHSPVLWWGVALGLDDVDHAVSFPFHEKAPTILPDWCCRVSLEPPERRRVNEGSQPMIHLNSCCLVEVVQSSLGMNGAVRFWVVVFCFDAVRKSA